jgi:hypothetical protein
MTADVDGDIVLVLEEAKRGVPAGAAAVTVVHAPRTATRSCGRLTALRTRPHGHSRHG